MCCPGLITLVTSTRTDSRPWDRARCYSYADLAAHSSLVTAIRRDYESFQAAEPRRRNRGERGVGRRAKEDENKWKQGYQGVVTGLPRDVAQGSVKWLRRPGTRAVAQEFVLQRASTSELASGCIALDAARL